MTPTLSRAQDAILAAAGRLAMARNDESRLEDARALVKRDAIQRLLASGAATSVTSAEKLVESDDEYADHRLRQREAVLETQMAWAGYECARLTAWALVRPEGQL